MLGQVNSPDFEEIAATARDVWASELARYDPADIKAALEALRYSHPEFPPTVFQFGNLCREAMKTRTQGQAKVEYVRYGKVDPRVIAAVAELTREPGSGKRDPRDWARRILKREQDGERVPLIASVSARAALGLVSE